MGLRPFSRHHHLLWIIALVLLACGTLLLAACGGTSSTSTSTPTATTAPTATPTAAQQTPTPTTSSGGNTAQVRIVDNGGTYAFSPATLTIAKGTTVTWTNTTFAPHTATSDDNTTFNGSISASQTFQMTFNTAGTFKYHCAIHTYMTATIIVTA